MAAASSMEARGASAFLSMLFCSRWMFFVAAAFIMSSGGYVYIFGLYSDAIKVSLKLNQQTLNTLSSFKNVGVHLGVAAGFLADVASPWVLIATGAGMNLFGNLMIWLAVSGHIPSPAIWQMNACMFIGQNSVTFTHTAIFTTCLKNFPLSRGIVLGLLAGFFGLSGAVFTQIYHAIYGENAISLILLIAWLPPLISLLFMLCIRQTRVISKEKDETRTLFLFLYSSLILAGFLAVIIVIENKICVSRITQKVVGAVTILCLAANIGITLRHELKKFLLHGRGNNFSRNDLSEVKASHSPEGEIMSGEGALPPIAVLKGYEISSSVELEAATDEACVNTGKATSPAPNCVQSVASSKVLDSLMEKSSATTDVKLPAVAAAWASVVHPHLIFSAPVKNEDPQTIHLVLPDKVNDQEDVAPRNSTSSTYAMDGKTPRSDTRRPQRGKDSTLRQALLCADIWLLIFSVACGVGANLTAIDNMGQIGEALGYSKRSIDTVVLAFSIWNFLGRVTSGFLSDMFLQRGHRVSRPLLLAIILAFSGIPHLLIASSLPGALYVASILTGMCFGAMYPVLFALISDLFGLRHYASLSNLVGVATPVGSYLLSVRVAGYLYDQEARRQALGGGRCHGASCFRLAFIIMAVVCFVGSLVSCVVVVRTKEFYKRDIYEDSGGGGEELRRGGVRDFGRGGQRREQRVCVGRLEATLSSCHSLQSIYSPILKNRVGEPS